MNKMFVSGEHRRLRLAPQSLTWITPPKSVYAVSTILRNAIPFSRKVKMLDMTANHGGDAIGLTYLVKNLETTAVELDAEIFGNLRWNIIQYPELKGRIHAINDDSTKHIGDDKYDIIYADPPFGDDYKSGNKYSLYIGDMEMSEIINASKAPLFFAKLPTDKKFKSDELIANINSDRIITVYYAHELDNYVLCNEHKGKKHKFDLYVFEKWH